MLENYHPLVFYSRRERISPSHPSFIGVLFGVSHLTLNLQVIDSCKTKDVYCHLIVNENCFLQWTAQSLMALCLSGV